MEQVHGYDYKADIWSLGITALELAKGYAPYAKYPPMKVLILTIQEAPPSLASYDKLKSADDNNNDEVVDESYSSQFQALVAWCLQRNPAKRPTCPELLASQYFTDFVQTRESRRDALCDQVGALVKDVGLKADELAASRSNSSMMTLPGNTPVSIVFSGEVEDRPAGTTWVFADGTQVQSPTRLGDHDDDDEEDVMAELDEFERQTGGEHYDRSNNIMVMPDNNSNYNSNHHAQQQDDSQSNDELDKFMDEFEQNTVGEDFGRNHPNL
jgi:serine/threonine-protein kinase OSR1/STK39